MARERLANEPDRWILLAYRLPREPAAPRLAVRRRLERIGVARLGDGLVALPADPRTREQFDWLAEEITEAGGGATVWLATPAAPGQEQQITAALRSARAQEYYAVLQEATAAVGSDPTDRARLVRRLREELHRIGRRDFYPPPERDIAKAAVQALADLVALDADADAERQPREEEQ